MTTVTFDTFKFVERLEKAGLPREQAAAIAEAQKEFLAEALASTLATKADAVRADLVRLENRMEVMTKDIQAAEPRLTVKLGVFMAASVGLVAAIVKLL